MGDDGIGFVLLCCLVLGAVLGASAGGCIVRQDMRSQAVERGYAQHDPKTGEWHWNDEAPKPTK